MNTNEFYFSILHAWYRKEYIALALLFTADAFLAFS